MHIPALELVVFRLKSRLAAAEGGTAEQHSTAFKT